MSFVCFRGIISETVAEYDSFFANLRESTPLCQDQRR